MVVSLDRGDTLFAENATVPLAPASTLKLYTSALAFDWLGVDYRFETQVYRTGIVDSQGVLHGDLVLRGNGDPSLSPRFFGGDANAPMRELARQVVAAGIRRIRGSLLGDDGAFEPRAIPDGWLDRYLHASYAARISALSLNENLVRVVVSPGASNQTPLVRLEPATTYFAVVNSATTVSGQRRAELSVSLSSERVISVRGWIGLAAQPRIYVLVVPDPSAFTTGAFAAALRAAGITIEGAIGRGRTPPQAVRVAAIASPPLVQLATAMNRESINHIAELLFRNAARVASPAGVGSASLGNAVLKDFVLLRLGGSPEEVYAADGSGLSTLNRLTARSLVQLLAYADRAPWGSAFHATLPVAGRDETLRLRMRRTPAQGNLHAKTGTTAEVAALSGYVESRNGERLAFALIYNGKDRLRARQAIDSVGVALARFAR
jgi:D-alanyl-D-alanine carboxypeptidase/D-alanyl-D-alanine-endopeptidase (penicillin-binding protein 4)